METMKFKTTLKCGGCVAKVTPGLNKIAGEGNWEVDVQDASKILSLKAEVSEQEVESLMKENGFQAERI